MKFACVRRATRLLERIAVAVGKEIPLAGTIVLAGAGLCVAFRAAMAGAGFGAHIVGLTCVLATLIAVLRAAGLWRDLS